jgi:hypothetical protein
MFEIPVVSASEYQTENATNTDFERQMLVFFSLRVRRIRLIIVVGYRNRKLRINTFEWAG